MLILFLYSALCAFYYIHCSVRESSTYHTFMFDGGGRPVAGDNSRIWIRFVAKTDPDDVFWLQLANQAGVAPMSLLVKSEQAAHSRESSSRTDAASCLYTAQTALTRPARRPSRPAGVNWARAGTTRHRLRAEIRELSRRRAPLDYEANRFLTVSLCHGIRGIVQLDNSSSYAQLHSKHHSHYTEIQVLQSAFITEGRPAADPLERDLFSLASGSVSRSLLQRRHKRSPSFHMPAGGTPGPFLVELYLIVDSIIAQLYRYDQYRALLGRVASILNQINMAFSQFRIYFAVVQLEIWEKDALMLTDENHILMELQIYKRRFVTRRHDCLHAILGSNLGKSRRGQAELASMCGYNSCVGYTKDYSGQDELKISHAILHELGHAFGLTHDTEQCRCYGCIMATGIEFVISAPQWSNCSRKQMDSLLKSGMADCLSDWPASDPRGLHPLIKEHSNELPGLDVRFGSVCGNGVVEDEEQCDCGTRASCLAQGNRCCEPTTCRFASGASCAGGLCCDLARCALKRRGTVCRSRRDAESCDLPEYCDGSSEWCPRDAHVQDGTACSPAASWEHSLCYRGRCETRQSRCRALWGSTGGEAGERCFLMNTEGGPLKNCGLDIPNQNDRDRQPAHWEGRRCSRRSARCGRLWCSHENERVLRPSAHVAAADLVLAGQHCSAVRFDMDWLFDEPGMVPNGAECGSGMACWNGSCVPAASAGAASTCFCHGHGVCNNFGRCHCDAGFAPPNCSTAGDGGSLDSGPLPPFRGAVRITITTIIICLIIILTGLVIATFIYHYRNHNWPLFLREVKWLRPRKDQSGGHSLAGNGLRSGSRPASKLIVTVDLTPRDSDKIARTLLPSPASPAAIPVTGLLHSERQVRPGGDRPDLIQPKPKLLPDNDSKYKFGKLEFATANRPGVLADSNGAGDKRPAILCEKPSKQGGSVTRPPDTPKQPMQKPDIFTRTELAKKAAQKVADTPMKQAQKPDPVTQPVKKSDIVTQPVKKPEIVMQSAKKPDIVAQPVKKSDIVTQPGKKSDIVTQPGKKPDIVMQPGKKPDIVMQPGKKPDPVTQPAKKPDTVMQFVKKPDNITQPVKKPDAITQPVKKPDTMIKPTQKSEAIKTLAQKPVSLSKDTQGPASQVGIQLAKDAVAKVLLNSSNKPLALRGTLQKPGSASGDLSDGRPSKQSSLAAGTPLSQTNHSSNALPTSKTGGTGPAGPATAAKAASSEKRPPILCDKPPPKSLPAATETSSGAPTQRRPGSARPMSPGTRPGLA